MSREAGSFESHPWPEDHEELHVCPNPECCAPDMMQPVTWERANNDDRPEKWHVLCRCAECDMFFEGDFGVDQIDEFDDKLDAYTRQVTDSLSRLQHENMEQFVDMFTDALLAGQVYPEDFGRLRA